MVSKQTTQQKIFDIFNIIVLSFLAFVTLYPFYYIAVGSVSDYTLVRQKTFLLFPVGFNMKAYGTVFKDGSILRGYLNTLYYVSLGTVINVIMTALGAYVLSRKNFYFKKFLMIMITVTMFFNGGLIPTFLVVRNLKMLDTVWAVVIPTAINTFNLIIMRTFFLGLPVELEESAKIDGANEWVVLFKIVIPLSLAIFAVMTLFYLVAHWNSWFQALIYFQNRKLYPLQLLLREILIVESMDTSDAQTYVDTVALSVTIKYATIMIATLPIICVYPFLQKYFAKGVMIGALKG